MSASPAKAANGTAPAPAMRKKAPVSVFQPKKKPVKKPLPAQAFAASGQVPASGARPAANGTSAQPPPAQEDDPSTYQEYSIVIDKNALTKGFHYHGFNLQSRVDSQGKRETVDPYNEAQFQRPVHLHRRRAQDKPELAEQSDVASGVDDKEPEVREAKRLERQAEREANQALIAPSGEPDKKPQRQKQQKKVVDVIYDENNPRNKARSQLRYEEARRWYLEDFEGKNKWVGAYEAPLSQKHVMFEISADGFKMVPIEKWYRFTPTDKVKPLSEAQIEKMMTAKHKAPRWFMKTEDVVKDATRAATAHKMEQLANARRVKRELDDDEAPSFLKNDEYSADRDEIDFEFEGEFQDDDEGFVYGEQPDEDSKEIEKRIREEMRNANLPDADMKNADDQDWVNEEKEQRNAEEEEHKRQKRIRKQLKKKELRGEYESDDEDFEKYMESSDSEDSDEERERLEEERKKEEAARAAAQANGDRSGASTKGTNTPTGRPEKRPMKRDADISDLSGNESSRKKAKLNGAPAVEPNGARSLSPDAAKRIPSGYGSGSDTDTSRPGRKLKLKNSPLGSPNHPSSRAGSPTGSRAQSPARPAGTPTAAVGGFPTLDEIKAAIPKDGIAIGDLVKVFKPRLGGKSAEFIALVKQAGKQDPVSKKIVPKD